MVSKGKRGVTAIAKALEGRIANGLVKEGSYLPSIRAVSKELGCASLTAHRAMRQLAQRGLVTAEPRLGYRVAAGGGHLPRTEMVAFLEETENYSAYLGDIYQAQMLMLQREAMTRGWTVVLVPYRRQSVEDIGEQLGKMGATSLVLQDIGGSFPFELLAGLVRLGLPTVNLDTPEGASEMDHVLRDEAHGAALAAEHLVRRGHRKIGWYGPLRGSLTGRRRFAGAAEVLLREGLEIDGQGWCDIDRATDTAVARQYLLEKGRPKAVLALWQTAARALAQAALGLGLTLGEDLDIVGWCMEEHFESGYAPACPELAKACATVTWSMADVGRMVLNRIEERRREPDLPAARIMLPMKLRLPAARSRETKK